ncbi:hypothetical protein SAMN05216548_104156 [Faunimonas pinastri]|uniref:DUF2065 domain-containing protein n=1 Tax=Faunimonas pinastri TaxID=1855383 RepID=A0A1H9FM95_9HYPH|nr:DUF2065 domain-containing protein [Faunimonas pinastri]SEQ38975.1 hypothetical protein SAMN05216548_104156 [Faunimonas pinastri]
MKDAVDAIGLVLVIEGIVYALFPNAMRRMAGHLAASKGDALRLAGLSFALLGFGIVWMARG